MAEHPRWPDGHLILGRWHGRRRRWHLALPHLRAYVALCPTHPEARVLLADSLLRVDGEAAGLACLREAMATCHFSRNSILDALRRHGSWLLELGRAEEAAEKFEEAVQLDSADAAAHTLLGQALLATGKAAAAASSFATGYAAGQRDAIIGLGVCQWESGSWQEGLETMVRARSELPEHPQAEQNLAKALATLDGKGVETAGLRRMLAGGRGPG
jgi:Flp pilus assembly protein TadD